MFLQMITFLAFHNKKETSTRTYAFLLTTEQRHLKGETVSIAKEKQEIWSAFSNVHFMYINWHATLSKKVI